MMRPLDLTAASSNSLRVIVSNIVVDPGKVGVRLLGRIGRLQILESPSNHTVAEQAWEQRNLQCKPILRLTDIEDIAAVCCAGCCKVSIR